MKKSLFIILFLLSVVSCHYNNASDNNMPAPIPLYRTKFIKKVAEETQGVNRQIQKKRAHLLKLYDQYVQHEKLSVSDMDWLKKLADNYHVKNPNFSNFDTWGLLEKRVDVLPLSLVIAQAAYESDWGRSRFAKQGNNYFGQRCYRIGCGIIPKRRSIHEKFEVQKFNNLQSSIKGYIHNLNTFPHYYFLRELRAEQRVQHNTIPNGVQLAEGLEKYAEQSFYVDAIKKIIQINHLEYYDTITR